MTSREVVINIGYKSEGVVSLNEFRYNPTSRLVIKLRYMLKARKIKRVSWFYRIRKPGDQFMGQSKCIA
jgi:hypothetical protein